MNFPDAPEVFECTLFLSSFLSHSSNTRYQIIYTSLIICYHIYVCRYMCVGKMSVMMKNWNMYFAILFFFCCNIHFVYLCKDIRVKIHLIQSLINRHTYILYYRHIRVTCMYICRLCSNCLLMRSRMTISVRRYISNCPEFGVFNTYMWVIPIILFLTVIIK